MSPCRIIGNEKKTPRTPRTRTRIFTSYFPSQNVIREVDDDHVVGDEFGHGASYLNFRTF